MCNPNKVCRQRRSNTLMRLEICRPIASGLGKDLIHMILGMMPVEGLSGSGKSMWKDTRG